VATAQALSSADVQRVTVTITGDDGIPAPIVAQLAAAANAWQGTIDRIPAGADRTFHGEAYDAAGVLLWGNNASGQCGVAGGMVLSPHQITF
jgi:hypothetical protein